MLLLEALISITSSIFNIVQVFKFKVAIKHQTAIKNTKNHFYTRVKFGVLYTLI